MKINNLVLQLKAYHNKAISRRFFLSPAYSVGLFDLYRWAAISLTST
jgi:hypothetical protein